MAKKIVFLTKGEHSASTRYRALNYFPHFRRCGWEPHHVSLRGGVLGKLRALKAAMSADVVVLVRRAQSKPWIFLFRLLSKTLAFDFDDAVFLQSSGQSSKRRMRRFSATLSKCDFVFAGNDYLKKSAAKFNSLVHVVPTSVDVSRYHPIAKAHSEYVDLVWIGSSSTRRYLELVLPALELAAQKNPAIRLKIIADFTLTSKYITVVSVAWSLEGEVEALQSSHVGIAPMVDDAWTRGKCALKVLQYMAAGLPVISSPCGVNCEVVKSGENGEFAESTDEWVEAVVKLASSQEERDRLGSRGRLMCEQEFDQEVCFKKLLRPIEIAVG